MTTSRKLLFGVAAFLTVVAAPVFAAQDAMITVEQAAIRERPSLDAKIIESKPVGAKIRVSSFGKDGWYKVKTSIGQFGWIWQADLTLLNFESDIKASNLEMPERDHDHRSGAHLPWFFFRLGSVTTPLVGQIGDTKGHLHFASGANIEFAVRIKWPAIYWWLPLTWPFLPFKLLIPDDGTNRFALRTTILRNVFGVAFSDNDTDVLPGVTEVMVGFQHDLSIGESSGVEVGLYAGYLGMGVANLQIVQAVRDPNTGGVTQLTGNGTAPGYGALLNVAYRHTLARWFSVVGEAGFFYYYVPQFDIPNFGSSHVSQFGPALSLGLQLSL